MNKIRVLLLGMLMALCAVQAPASAEPSSWYNVKLANGYWNSYCLAQGSGGSQYHTDFARTSVTYCPSSGFDSAQQWAWLNYSAGAFHLLNLGTDGCLNGDANTAYQNYPCLQPWGASRSGNWSLVVITGTTEYLIRSKTSGLPGVCVSAPWWDNRNVRLAPCNAGYSDQRWEVR